jgi:multidrug efflux pump subunit AcrA (membrane-fusion protein)
MSRNAMKHSWLVWIGLGIIVLVAGVLLVQTLLAYFRNSNPEQLASEIDIQQALAHRGTLTLSVSGTGEFVATDEFELGFQENGQLVALNVKIGDQVQAGDVLAQLKISQEPAELSASISAAQLKVLQEQQNLDRLYQNAAVESAQALLTLEEAQLALGELENYEDEQALAEQQFRLAEGVVDDAQMNLYIVNSSPSQSALDTAHASLLFKEKELKELQDQIARAEFQFKSAPNEFARVGLNQQILNLRAQLSNKQLEYEKALYKYNTLDDPPDTIQLSVAEAQLRTAQVQQAEALKDWQATQAGPPDGDLAMAEAQLAAAQTEWERVKDGPDPDEIRLAEAQLAEAEAELKLLESGELTLDLLSPIDGTVLSIDAQVGDRIDNQVVLTLADLSQPLVEVYLDEIDFTNVQVGDRAEIIFDPIPDKTFLGEVVQVDPQLRGVGNSQGVQVLVILDEPPTSSVNLPLGLNAGVDIIAEEATNVVLVVLDAIEQNSEGSDIVYVIEGEQVEMRLIQVGLKDATTAEIVAGLEPGERVAIGGLDFTQE